MLYCTPVLAAQGLYPAVDPLISTSSLLDSAIVGKEHIDVATRVREIFAEANRLTADPDFLELLACRVPRSSNAWTRIHRGSRSRVESLSEAERTLVLRSRKLERFLTTRFFVAEETNKRPGSDVPLAETLRGCEAILDGTCDAIAEESFAYIGRIDEAEQKADRTANA